MTEDVEKQQVTQLKAKKFVFQLVKSILRDNEAILWAYIQFLDGNRLEEEILFAKSFKTDTKDEKDFKVFTYFKENNISLQNRMDCSNDGIPFLEAQKEVLLCI